MGLERRVVCDKISPIFSKKFSGRPSSVSNGAKMAFRELESLLVFPGIRAEKTGIRTVFRVLIPVDSKLGAIMRSRQSPSFILPQI